MSDQQVLAGAVVTAATEVFGTMLGLRITTGEAYLETRAARENERVVALIGLAGDWIGTGVVSCTPECACRISSLLLMTEFSGITEDVLDAMAEMANMIFGNVKTILEGQFGSLGLSIPTVIFGRNFATRSAGRQAWVVVPVHSGEHLLELKMCLTRNHDQKNSMQPVTAYSIVTENA